ncbi:hypothetical protein RB195_009015 [Necator americanus]|uniref:SCP domain-containing protein n=1 Tax=Necator americanus TaxID=51031 RepID=A0ABR1CRD2_NECAM
MLMRTKSLLARGLVRNGMNPKNRNLSAASYMPAMMAWAKSVQIGCAINTCDRSSVLVCRYNPAGNILNQQIYQPGRVCSGCLGACNTSDGPCKIL